MKKLAAVLIALLFSATLADAACWQWSTTAATNATADPSINWAEGMAPSAVNDSARAMMARLAECRDDLSGKLVTSGTSTAYTVTTNQVLASTPNDGQQITVQFHVANGAAPTLAADGGTAFPIQSSAGLAVSSGVLLASAPYRLTYRSASTAWILQGFYNTTTPAGSIVTAMLANNSVTYQKMQRPSTTSRLLGTPTVASKAISAIANNGSGLIRVTVASTADLTTGQTKVITGVVGTTEANGTWVITVINGTALDLVGSTFTNAYVSGGTLGGTVEEIIPGTGLRMSTNTLIGTVPVPGAYKNLSIKVASNTTVTVAADFVATTDGTNYQTQAVSCTINLGGTGINGLDTGTIASASWYAIWINSKSDGTTGCTASLQFTANGTFIGNQPSGYTYYARVGAVRTASGSAQLLGTWQFGRKAQYVVGLAQTSVLPLLDNGVHGTYSTTTPTWAAVPVSNFVPSTASKISFFFTSSYNGGNAQNVIAAPNNSYTGSRGLIPPPLSTGNLADASLMAEFVLESTNIYWASSSVGAPGGALFCLGWEDNI